LECLGAVSYHGKAQTSGEVTFKQVDLPDVADRDVLVVDDILDTGHTLAAVREQLATAKPCSIRVCVVLSKRKRRARDVDADYVGFEIEDEFVVGYGLDLRPALCKHDKNILIGAGLEFVNRNYKLKSGEEIAIMPPVQGG
jgi:hypoxanthine phosphoribosyltransferase